MNLFGNSTLRCFGCLVEDTFDAAKPMICLGDFHTGITKSVALETQRHGRMKEGLHTLIWKVLILLVNGIALNPDGELLFKRQSRVSIGQSCLAWSNSDEDGSIEGGDILWRRRRESVWLSCLSHFEDLCAM